MFSRELHITPEALPEALVEVDRLLEPLSKGARAALFNLREKQAIPSDTVTENTEPAKETKIAFDNKHVPMPIQKLSRDMTRNQVSTTPSKEFDGKHEWVDVAKERMRKETVAHTLPKHVPDLMTDVPKFDADTERNILKSHILAKRDRVAVNGEYDNSSSNAHPGAERWRRLALLRSGDVEPNPAPLRARSRGGELLTADITAGTVAKFRRAFAAFDFYPVVTRAVCHLHMDFSSLSKLSRGIWNGFLDLTDLLLKFRELWSMLCVELLCAQFSSVRRLLLRVFISVLCGDCINFEFSHYHQNPVHPWTSSTSSPLSFSFRARGLRFAEKVYESNHRLLTFSTQMGQARRLRMPACWV